MAEIKTTAGTVVHVDAGGISVLTLGTGGTVLGGLGEQVTTAEAPEALLARLSLTKGFARLTRPDGSALWVKGAAVSLVREPLATEVPPDGTVKAVVLAGGHYAVSEDVRTAMAWINANGGAL
ncbi:hypothetical protein [Nitrospirillum iridis]|uniref:Uncharacterized protein n=1 Tax=Nitrospirillum iridis TaxID=765888 RepID=A0A7X0B0Q5_9PROT|nr:hypothetical protein [Nitrospirillum iridis]MBB6252836.1 hypothetical protein [Nitrospirillum iridis]